MEVKITKQDYNPWDVSSIFDFNYFCCPECDCKEQNKQEFINHATTYHSWVSQHIFRPIHPPYVNKNSTECQQKLTFFDSNHAVPFSTHYVDMHENCPL